MNALQKVVAFSFLMTCTLWSLGQTKTVHLTNDKSGMDLYLDVPEKGEVRVFRVGFAHRINIVSIHLEEGTELGDMYFEEYEATIADLKKIKEASDTKHHFIKYQSESDKDLILEYKNDETGNIYYEFHYINELNGKPYYFCSDGNKEYTLAQVQAMHKMAESLRTEK